MMKRRLLQLLFALGLLLNLAAGALFIRGLWRSDHFAFDRIDVDGVHFVTEHLEMHFTAAEWSFQWQRITEIDAAWIYDTIESPFFELRHDASHPWPPVLKGEFAYDSILSEDDTIRIAARAGAIPAWCVLIVIALLNGASGLVLWRGRRRRLREARNLCPTCGYDLRGADHERCPECGESVAVTVM